MIWRAWVNVFFIATLSMCIGIILGQLGYANTVDAATWVTVCVVTLAMQFLALGQQLLKLKRAAQMADTAEQFQ